LIFVARDNRCVGWVGLQDKTRAEAMEMTRQAQTPRLSYPVMTETLTERLTPRPITAADKPKEARR
jgi:hypothetical protein